MTLQPYPYQQEIIDRYENTNVCALLMDPGTGKTLIALNFLRGKYNKHQELLRTIVFCPSIVLNNWRREFLSCTNVPSENIGVVMGSKKKRLNIINNESHRVLIINHEAVLSAEVLKALTSFEARAVIVDESHKIKNHRMKTTAGKKSITGGVLQVAAKSWYRCIMSGTPAPNPEDIWSQYYFLDHGKTFGDKFYSFKNRYFVNKNAGWTGAGTYPDWQFIESKAEEYKDNLRAHATSMRREECVDLPELVQQFIDVEPSAEMLKHYRAVLKDLITWIDSQPDNPLVVQNALTRSLRLAEILSGYLKLEDGSVETIKNNSTLDALMQLVDSLCGARAIIFCQFQQNYKDISQALRKRKIDYVEIHGGVSKKAQLTAEARMNDPLDPVQIAIVNPQSGGVGINLKLAGVAIYYTPARSLIDFEQSRARNFRSGSIDHYQKIVHYFIRHKGLVTEHLFDSLINRKIFADNLLDLKNKLL